MIEPLYARIVRETQGVEVPTPFPRMTYDEMMDRYGSDKPDLRYGMELADVGEVFAGTGFRAFASVLDSAGLIKAFAAPGGAQLSRKELDELVQVAKSRGAAGVVLDRGRGRRGPFTGREAPVARGDRGRAPGHRRRIRRPDPDRGRQARPDERGARRTAAAPRRSARPDPGGRVAVLLVLGAAAVRLVGRGGQVGLEPPPLHLAAHRRSHARDREGARVRPRR